MIKLKKNAKIVIKIGSSILTSDTNQIDIKKMGIIVSQVCRLKEDGFDVVLVSSGAIACGMEKLGLDKRPDSVLDSCATASVGQILLMRDYEELFRRDGYLPAQILLTSDGLHDRKRYLNARNTIFTLFERVNIIPIVNENDAVATDEIKFGDNDMLSAQVACLIDADILIILSNVDGLYNDRKELVPEVPEITDGIYEWAKGPQKKASIGGMITKLEAAKVAVNSGISVVIANGNKEDTVLRICRGEKEGTCFSPKADRISAKKRWIAFSCKDCGRIIIDAGAKQALLEKGTSLLAIGVVGLEGDFSFGDLVIICGEDGREIARGLTNYSAEELDRIKRKKTAQIEEILGGKSYDEVVHRDNLAVIG